MKRFFLTLCAVCAATFAWTQEIYYVDVDTWTPSSDWEDGCFTCERQGDGSLKIVSFKRDWGPVNPDDSDFKKCPGADFDLSRVFGSTKLIVGNGVFANLQMNSLIFSENTIEIGSGACSGCVNLSSIEIPESVTLIGADAFSGCSGLSEITFYGAPPSATSTSFPSATGRYTSHFDAWANVIVDGKWNNLSMECDWSLVFNYSVANNRVTINGLDDSSYSGALSIPSTIDGCPVTSIGDWAFSGCSGLTSVTIPEGVTSIGYCAFMNCSSLKSIKLPESLREIVDGDDMGPEVCYGVFSGCKSLKTITIPGGVTSIGDWVFFGCTSLTSVTISEGVTSIEGGAFFGCTSLTSVTISEGVTSIGGGAFSGCSGLTSVTIPSSVTSIWGSAFAGCSSLTSVTIPGGVKSIGGYAFYSCAGLTSVTISEGVTSIEDGAFYGCSGLTSITIPESVTSIGYNAFYNCSSLTSITIPSSVTSIGDSAFTGCTVIKEMIFKGPPPHIVPVSNREKRKLERSEGISNPETLPATKGYYLPEHAEAWENVLNGESGRWNNLQMQLITKDTM